MIQARTTRNALLCVAIYLACLLIAWPVAEMGFDDDWSYIKTAQAFAQTGHLAYNGWAAPMLGWQTAWGALFIKRSGFSFMAAKLSMLPVSIACIIVFYLTLVRFGIHGRNAILGTLTLALSPLFLPLSVSFMTDVPGLLAILVCLYLCKRAVDSASTRAAILWLIFAAAASLIGGTARQTGWLGALVMVPSCGWLLRRRGALTAALALGMASFAVVLLCLAWMHRQPYWIGNDLQDHIPLGSLMHGILTLYEVGGGLLSLAIVVVPVLAIWLWQLHAAGRYDKALCVGVVFFAALMQLAGKRPLPWVLHTMDLAFSPQRIATLRPAAAESPALQLWIAFVAVVLLAASATVCACALVQRLRRRALSSQGQQIFWLCVPFTAAYAALLLPRALHALIFDRYMLVLAPVAILCLVHLYTQAVQPRLPNSSLALLLLLAALSVAGTHDWFAWQRARLAAIAELTSAGIPRTALYGGVEFDGWTQIEHGGFINNPWLTNPPGAYKPQPPVPQDDSCAYDLEPFTPSIHAQYTIVFEPRLCFAPAPFAPVTYTSWIPPFRRTIYVQRVRRQGEGAVR